jgi:hypothetical protein
MLETPKELAIRLFRENRRDIAAGIYRLACRLQPRWRSIDANAFEHNGMMLIEGLERFLATGENEKLFKVARDLIHIRRLGGFHGVEMNVVIHAYMPVIRKAFIARAPSVRQGLAAYDAAEAVCLPFITRVIEAIGRADDATDPDPPFHGRPFEAVSVGDEIPEFLLAGINEDDSEEETDPRGGR